MPYKITIELSDRDLRHFRRELKRSAGVRRHRRRRGDPRRGGRLVQALQALELPDFVAERLGKLETLHAMLTDPDWTLRPGERSPVLAALAYVCDPEDIIPDDMPGHRPARRRRDDRTRVPRTAPRDRGVRGIPCGSAVVAETLSSRREVLAAKLDRRRTQLMAACGAVDPGAAARVVSSRDRAPDASSTAPRSGPPATLAMRSPICVGHALARLHDRHAHGARERRTVRAAVALDDHAGEPDHARAVVGTRVEPALQAAQRRRRRRARRACAAGSR